MADKASLGRASTPPPAIKATAARRHTTPPPAGYSGVERGTPPTPAGYSTAKRGTTPPSAGNSAAKRGTTPPKAGRAASRRSKTPPQAETSAEGREVPAGKAAAARRKTPPSRKHVAKRSETPPPSGKVAGRRSKTPPLAESSAHGREGTPPPAGKTASKAKAAPNARMHAKQMELLAERAEAGNTQVEKDSYVESWIGSSVVLEDLKIIGLIGNGGFASVTLRQHVPTGQTYAVKSLSKGYVQKTGMENMVLMEKKVMQLLCSPFVVKLYGTFNTPEVLHFLIEPALGGELYFTYQKKALHGKVPCAQFYIACVVIGLEHLHERNVIYRGVVPENVVLDEFGFGKLCDFGLSKVLHKGLLTYTCCGVPDYFAPEMVVGEGHNHSLDWWCVGVLLFELLCGHPPFESATPMQTYAKVRKGIKNVSFPTNCQDSAQNLVERLLVQHNNKRLPMLRGGVDNLKKHAWYGAFDWNALSERSMTPPYLPSVKSSTDTGNFNARKEDSPPNIPYKNDHTGWDRNFETELVKAKIVLNPSAFGAATQDVDKPDVLSPDKTPDAKILNQDGRENEALQSKLEIITAVRMGGCCPCFGGSSAPYLREYFQVQLEFNKAKSPATLEDAFAMMADPAKMNLEKKKMRDKLFNIIQQSFKLHDTKGTNVLDKEEAAVFFSHFVAEFQHFAKSLQELQLEKSNAMSQGLLQQMMGGDRTMMAEAKKGQEMMLKQVKEEAKKQAQQKWESYIANKQQRDAAAFAVLDTDKSGTLELNEVINALMPETEGNKKFSIALGMATEEEIALVEAMQGMMSGPQGGQAQCPQQ